LIVHRRFVFALAVPAAALAGCGHHHTQGVPAGNTLRYAIGNRPTTFDPAMVQDSATIDLLQNIFEGLVQWTPDGKLAPDLAQSWAVSADGLTYTFHLRKDVKFQDGSSMTAQDVAFSLRRALDPGLASPVALDYLGNIVGAKEFRAGQAKDLAGVEIVDPGTLRIRVVKPGEYWIDSLTYPTAFVVSAREASPSSPMTDADVMKGAGTGPFRLQSYSPNQDVKLAANAAYFDGAPKLSGIDRPIVTSANTRHAMYQQGELDIVDVQRGDLDADLKDPSLKNDVRYFPRAATFYLALNQKALPAFRDARVRQAIACAIDKERIRHVVLADRMDVAEDMLPEGIPGYDPAFKGLPCDPAKAKQLLAEAGYPGGKGFPAIDITYREGNPDLEKTVDLIREMLDTNLGITVNLRRLEWSVMLQLRNKDTLPAWHSNWIADYPDPQDFYSTLFHTGSASNHVGYSNPAFDSLCDRADVEKDPQRRIALYRQAGRILANDVPMIPIYYLKSAELIKPYVHGIDDCALRRLPMRHVEFAR
jgi:ABC-type transport system substrate-binding protein